MYDDFHVGDVVRIRDWDDMVAEFGIDRNGDIPCRAHFVRGMRRLCGNVFTITNTDGCDVGGCTHTMLRITTDMIEHVQESEEVVLQEDITEMI